MPLLASFTVQKKSGDQWTDGQTNQWTEGQTLLKRCLDASKNVQMKKNRRTMKQIKFEQNSVDCCKLLQLGKTLSISRFLGRGIGRLLWYLRRQTNPSGCQWRMGL